MDLINQFIENYKKKLTFYENLGRISSSQLEDALQSAGDRKSTRLNSSHEIPSRMPSSA